MAAGLRMTRGDWLGLVLREHRTAEEEVVLICRLKKPHTLSISKVDLKRCFGRSAGIELDVSRHVRIAGSARGGRSVALPAAVVRTLSLSPGDSVCLSRRQEGKACVLRRFVLRAGESEVPGRVLIDAFEETQVVRTHYEKPDVDDIRLSDVQALVRRMGPLRRDPLAPLKHAGGRIGYLFRRELSGRLRKQDEAFADAQREATVAAQRRDGCWEGSLVTTGFQLIRLVKVGVSADDPAIEKAAAWLLDAPEPDGLPGLFLATPELAEQFNRSKRSGRDPGVDVYNKVRRASGSEYRRVRESFARRREVVPGVCELGIVSTSAVVLQALLRLGFAEAKRVRTAIHTLLCQWGGRWCGCGWYGPDSRTPASQDVDFNGPFPIPSDNERIYRSDWFPDPRQIRQITAMRKVSPHYSWRKASANRAVIEKHSVGMGNCTLGVHEALSYHPAYAGSNLEANGALEFARRQGSLGHWGDTPPSVMLHTLARLSHPLAAFLVARTVPLLLRRQRPDGLWPPDDAAAPQAGRADEGPIPPNSPEEIASFRILRALERFGFLDMLRP